VFNALNRRTFEITPTTNKNSSGLVVRVPGYRPRSPGFDFKHYQIFWKVVGLEQGPLISWVQRTTEELLGRNISGSGLKIRIYGHGDSLQWPCGNLYLQKLALTLSGGRSISIVRSWTKVTKFSFLVCYVSFLDWCQQQWWQCSAIHWGLKRWLTQFTSSWNTAWGLPT
jgi:hypothetical protein